MARTWRRAHRHGVTPHDASHDRGPAGQVGDHVEEETLDVVGADPGHVEAAELLPQRPPDGVAELQVQLLHGRAVTRRQPIHDRRQLLEPPCLHPLRLSTF